MPIKPVDIVLSNGVEVILRPAGPEDEPRFEHIVANMSEESRYLPLHHHLLDLGDGLGRVQALRAGLVQFMIVWQR
jgi:hypothetical protein